MARNKGWVIVVFEDEFAQFRNEVAYVKGPFETYEAAEDWAHKSKHCTDGKWQQTFIEGPED